MYEDIDVCAMLDEFERLLKSDSPYERMKGKFYKEELEKIMKPGALAKILSGDVKPGIANVREFLIEH